VPSSTTHRRCSTFISVRRTTSHKYASFQNPESKSCFLSSKFANRIFIYAVLRKRFLQLKETAPDFRLSKIILRFHFILYSENGSVQHPQIKTQNGHFMQACTQNFDLIFQNVPRCRRKTAWAINIKVHGRCSACTDPEVKRSKVTVTGLSSALPVWVCRTVSCGGY